MVKNIFRLSTCTLGFVSGVNFTTDESIFGFGEKDSLLTSMTRSISQ
ncbi:uncharacterized protein METZ01_LOCUS293106 [marine metagenome]|uniref:Uncharacterized protein n=1 Tax=marine metagenome TaxID=408172 RepID=A0A382LYV3_9ZZZZ